ncbi:hypothetical protein [Amycolatopsis sp. CA-230715]|uniref:hypothetical protein n=1 Tax=Amycolatopsis sp. CA-230715 TaxID=2745196 RepID=UPI001C037A3C|nr:hypothetical protein [Amycolatopsis sp. CA-230715]QWF80860.1 hypothetical protein HUW46_04285 [Amycolatopsis sp. CA-230715]
MTYPPPQGGPGQWEPAPGQGGPGQFGPPQQGFPQQGFPPPGYGPPGYGPPPKKSKAGLVVGLVLGLVVVLGGVVAILGFVAPGFFLSKDVPINGQAIADPKAVLDALADKLNRKDRSATDLMCQSSSKDEQGRVRQLMSGNISGGHDFRVKEGPIDNADSVVAQLLYQSKFPGDHVASVQLRKGPDGFCVFSVTK